MTGADPSALALFWAGVVGVAILIYVVLDGFDLGVGMLFGTTRDERLRAEMIETIAPIWDGNETWLVVVGVSLFGAFPVVYAVFLPAFYIPVLLLLGGLIFRGVAFEFRIHASSRRLWDIGFAGGSALAAFVQGAAVGTMIRGIPVVDRQFAGSAFEWIAPLPMLCGVGLMLGYCLLGAGWLVLKAEGPLRAWCYARIPWLTWMVFVVLAIAFVAAADERERFADMLARRPWGILFPIVSALAAIGILVGARRRDDAWPFALTVVFFVMSFLTLAALFWPYMIPYSVTVSNAAAPEESLEFLFWGAGLFGLPVVLIYTIVVYWIFRGKAKPSRHGGY